MEIWTRSFSLRGRRGVTNPRDPTQASLLFPPFRDYAFQSKQLGNSNRSKIDCRRSKRENAERPREFRACVKGRASRTLCKQGESNKALVVPDDVGSRSVKVLPPVKALQSQKVDASPVLGRTFRETSQTFRHGFADALWISSFDLLKLFSICFVWTFLRICPIPRSVMKILILF